MRDRYIQFANGETRKVADLPTGYINQLLGGSIPLGPCDGDLTAEAFIERLRIELVARELGGF